MSAAHEVRHALPSASQAKPPHGLVIGAGHEPVPVQFAAAVALPPTQLALRHSSSELVKALHAVRSAPSHVARSQSETSPAGHAERPPRGAPLIATHFPSLPTALHASH